MMGIRMRKSVALLLVPVFLLASCIVAVKPALSSSGVVEDSWVSRAPMQQARSYLGVAAVNGKIYAIGGKAENGVVGTNEEYDPETNTWALKTPMPTPRAGFATAVYQNKIYCIGGSNHTGVNEVYDPATDSWTTKASIPTATSIYVSAVVDNEIYVIGGDGAGELNQMYDTETDTWSQRTPLTSSTATAVAGATTGVNAPKRIYVLGQHFHLPQQPYFNLVYDPENDSWTDGVAVPTARRGLGIAVLNDKLYAIGGYTEVYSIFPWEQPTVTYYATNEQYTPIGYGTPDPSYVPPDSTAPEIAVASPQNKTYSIVDVALNFTVNETVSSMRYTLDGETVVEISGNTTLTGLAYGAHNLTVYAVDAAGNVGSSETVFFTIAEPEPFPVAAIAVASTTVAAAICVGLGVYLTKTRKNQKPKNASSTDSSNV